MKSIILTKYDGVFVGPFAVLLGFLMDAIFRILNFMGIPNVGLAIILFTLVVNICLLPLTYKQQKFSKMSAKTSSNLSRPRSP